MSSFQFLGIPPKGERGFRLKPIWLPTLGFQFLGIPPKGELPENVSITWGKGRWTISFQFLGIPPKGELDSTPGRRSGTPSR